MNPENQLIIINGNDKTESVASMEYTGDGRCRIRFEGTPKVYTYNSRNIKVLKPLRTIDPSNVIVYVRGNAAGTMEKIIDYGTCYRFYGNGHWFPVYAKGEVTLAKNCLADGNARTLFDYFKEIAAAVGIVAEQGQNLLSLQYSKIKGISDETVLSKYFGQKGPEPLAGCKELLFPFGLNQSQIAAVENAFSSQISIIQGPPGTGKTQTILNIIANAVLNGKTVAVVSNNNSATANVAEKLGKHELSFISAFLGSIDNKNRFLERQPPYPNMNAWVLSQEDRKRITDQINTLRNELDKMLEARNRIAAIEQQRLVLEPEQTYYASYYASCPNIENGFRPLRKLSSAKLSALWAFFEEKATHLSFWDRLYLLLQYGRRSIALMKHEATEAIPLLQHLFYEKKLEELQDEKVSLEKRLLGYHFEEQMETLKHLSMRLFKAELARRYPWRGPRKHFEMGDFRNNSQVFNAEYPVILSTTYSIKGTLDLNHIYDYLIIDEASQVDLATGVLAFSCARNVVIVGDLKQLPNVLPEQTSRVADDIWNRGVFAPPYRFTEHSLLSSAAALWKDAPSVMLREHYRCHPKIAEFFNRKFYSGELIVMTEDRGEPDALCMYRTVEGNHARGHLNQRQIDVIREEVLPQLEQAGHYDIGIITPYRDQVAAIQRQLGDRYEVATVHKFQGREKDAIILTSVDNTIGAFVDDPNLLNVAVSRAIRSLTVIMSANRENDKTNFGDLAKYIDYNNYARIDSQVYSVFDMLYADYAAQRMAYLKKHRRISEYDSENLAFSVIEEVLKQSRFQSVGCAVHSSLATLVKDYSAMTEEEIRYAANPLTHLDFLLFSTMNRAPLLAIEIDGTSFHTPGSAQAQRDVIKDRVMDKLHIPMLRIRTDESSERTRIEAALLAAIASQSQPGGGHQPA